MKETKQLLSDVVAEKLSALIKEKYHEGDKIPTEPKLAEMFSVSRITIREAVSNLKSRGILEVRQGDGTYVKLLSPSDLIQPMAPIFALKNVEIDKIYEVRILIEVKAVDICASKGLSEEQNKIINELMEQMNQMAMQKNIFEYNKLDVMFHKTLVRCCGNEILYTINEMLLDLTEEAIQKSCTKLEHVVDSLIYHNKVLYAIRDKNPDLASKAMTEHIEGGLRFIKSQEGNNVT